MLDWETWKKEVATLFAKAEEAMPDDTALSWHYAKETSPEETYRQLSVAVAIMKCLGWVKAHGGWELETGVPAKDQGPAV